MYGRFKIITFMSFFTCLYPVYNCNCWSYFLNVNKMKGFRAYIKIRLGSNNVRIFSYCPTFKDTFKLFTQEQIYPLLSIYVYLYVFSPVFQIIILIVIKISLFKTIVKIEVMVLVSRSKIKCLYNMLSWWVSN